MKSPHLRSHPLPRVQGVLWPNHQQENERIIAAAEDIGAEDYFPIQCLDAMKGLWDDASVQLTIRRGNEYALHDNIQ